MKDLAETQPNLLRDLQDLGLIYRNHLCANTQLRFILLGLSFLIL